MKKGDTVVVVDSGCDIPQAFIEKHHMKVLRLRISYEHEHYPDSVELAKEVYRRFPAEIPRTSTPIVQDYYDVVEEIKNEGYKNVIGIFISGKLSSTFQTAKMVFSEFPELTSFIFDSKNISIGAGLLGMWAAIQLEKQVPFEIICEQLPAKAKQSKVFFYMDTLEYLRKGGRIGGVTAVAGGLLKIKPIISCDAEGAYYTVEKIRGVKAGKEKILAHVEKMCGDQPTWMALMNGDGMQSAKEVKPVLKKRVKNGIIVAEGQITASLAIHTGPGLLGVGVLVNP